MAKRKTYPDRTLYTALAKLTSVKLLWDIHGPKDTQIAWVSCYAVNGYVVLVQTFADHHGWDAYTADSKSTNQDAIDDVIERCHLKSIKPEGEANA